MGNRIANIGGGPTHVSSVHGSIKTAAKAIKELRFEDSVDSFPAVGLPSMLYIDTSTNKLYRWNGVSYEEVSGLTGIIDDLSIAEDKTWSSSKIGNEFSEDRQSIDNIGNISPLTNLEIEAILNA